jgi:hypothetical protein
MDTKENGLARAVSEELCRVCAAKGLPQIGPDRHSVERHHAYAPAIEPSAEAVRSAEALVEGFREDHCGSLGMVARIAYALQERDNEAAQQRLCAAAAEAQLEELRRLWALQATADDDELAAIDMIAGILTRSN